MFSCLINYDARVDDGTECREVVGIPGQELVTMATQEEHTTTSPLIQHYITT